jgi:hypothetical protein
MGAIPEAVLSRPSADSASRWSRQFLCAAFKVTSQAQPHLAIPAIGHFCRATAQLWRVFAIREFRAVFGESVERVRVERD